MKKYLFMLLILPIFLLGCNRQEDNFFQEKLYFFYSDTCPHCHDALKYIDAQYPELTLTMINVANEGGLELLIKAAQKFKLGNRVGTPLFVWKDQYLMGWSPQNEKLFNELAQAYLTRE